VNGANWPEEKDGLVSVEAVEKAAFYSIIVIGAAKRSWT
jgi:hypothetical protein